MCVCEIVKLSGFERPQKIFKISPKLRKIDENPKIIGPFAFYVNLRKITQIYVILRNFTFDFYVILRKFT